MEISIGTLIIGSLCWEDQIHRTQWRGERLDLTAKRNVLAPIRYGHRAQTRGNSHTMVFSEALSREETKLGEAIIVPYKQRVQRVEQLVTEAENLWAAERNSNMSNGHISANWGCVALAVNPTRPIPHHLAESWATRVSREQGYGQLDHADDEKVIIERSGLMNIPWPQCTDGSPLELDALLAIATKPTLVHGCYPLAQQVAGAWRTDEGRNYVQYFWKNRKHNIFTFQDGEIEDYL